MYNFYSKKTLILQYVSQIIKYLLLVVHHILYILCIFSLDGMAYSTVGTFCVKMKGHDKGLKFILQHAATFQGNIC